MMHEYQAENMVVQENSKEEDPSSSCRSFLQFDEWPNNEECNPVSPEHYNLVSPEQCDPVRPEQCDAVSPELSDPVGAESMLMRYLEQEERNSLRDAANGTQVVGEDEQKRQELSGGPPQDLVPLQDPVNGNSGDDRQTTCDFSKGDFLELADLYDPESSSTSSDNSSLSKNSDDYFDAEALLRDIENECGLNMDEDRVDHRFNISTSVRSNQVFVRPPTSGSVYNDNINLVDSDKGSADSIAAPNTTLSLSTMDPQSDADISMSGSSRGSQVNDTRSGSSERGSSPRGPGSKSVCWISKLGKKYCCFAPF